MKPQKPSQVAQENANKLKKDPAESRRKNRSLSRVLKGGRTSPPGPRGSLAPESTSQGEEFLNNS